MIMETDVEQMASLARLELGEEEKKKFQKDLGSVLEFVEKLKKLNVEGVEPTTVGLSIGKVGEEAVNVMRADEPRFEHDSEAVNKMLEQAPDSKDNFVKVKNILNKN